MDFIGNSCHDCDGIETKAVIGVSMGGVDITAGSVLVTPQDLEAGLSNNSNPTLGGELSGTAKNATVVRNLVTIAGQVTGTLANSVISKGLALDVLSLTDGKATLTGGNLTTTGDIVADDVTGDVGTFNSLKVTGDVDFSATAIESIGNDLVDETVFNSKTLGMGIPRTYYGADGLSYLSTPLGWVSVNGYVMPYFKKEI